jgi:two-component system NtrC family sensor kinase
MAVVGELAARLAHELRNPLAGMQMALTNLQREISEHDKAQRLGLVVDELNRVTALLNSLLDQSRHHPEPVKLMRLAPVIEELLTLARYQTPETIQIEQDIAEEIECRLPENGLRRTLLNLILNACQAIGDQPGHIRVSARIEKDSLIIDVTDDGPGFPPTLLQSGIRPFISTRSDGTGLGLASVQRFATDLQGRLELRNVEPHGARVTLILPAAGENHG